MQIKKLCLTHFRNYSSEKIEFTPNISFFYGANAQGKTNILEALCFLSTTQTPRTRNAQELIQWGQAEATVEGTIKTRQAEKRVAIQIKRDGAKTMCIDHHYLKRASELLGQFPVVFFSPEDLEIIKKSPQGRRRFIDVLLSQTSKQYAFQLMQYHKILKQRNSCLKQISESKAESHSLDVWDEELIETGFKITDYRKKSLDQLIPNAEKIHQELTEQQELLEVKYLCSLGEQKIQAREKLKQYRRNEIATQKTCFGPHRDDLLILINKRQAKAFASHGQQRTAIISMKMAELEYMEQVFKEKPIVLLDDILLELDSQRLAALLKNLLNSTQTIITGTETHRLEKLGPQDVHYYEVAKGKIKQQDGIKVS